MNISEYFGKSIQLLAGESPWQNAHSSKELSINVRNAWVSIPSHTAHLTWSFWCHSWHPVLRNCHSSLEVMESSQQWKKNHKKFTVFLHNLPTPLACSYGSNWFNFCCSWRCSRSPCPFAASLHFFHLPVSHECRFWSLTVKDVFILFIGIIPLWIQSHS